MAHVLAPSLELFRLGTKFFAQGRQCMAHAMGIEIGQACQFECGLEHTAHRPGVFPECAFQPYRRELAVCVQSHIGCRKKRIGGRKAMFPDKLIHPLRDNVVKAAFDRKECCGDRLSVLGVDIAAILKDLSGFQVHMLERKRCNGTVTRAGQKCERQNCPVAPFPWCVVWHGVQCLARLVERRELFWPFGLGNARVIVGRVEILAIRKADA